MYKSLNVNDSKTLERQIGKSNVASLCIHDSKKKTDWTFWGGFSMCVAAEKSFGECKKYTTFIRKGIDPKFRVLTSRMDKIPNGQNPEYLKISISEISMIQNPEYWKNPERTKSRITKSDTFGFWVGLMNPTLWKLSC